MTKKNMKIAILTHKLGHNYGGVLQAYALRAVVSTLVPGAKVLTYHAYYLKMNVFTRIKSTVGRTLRYRKLYWSSLAIEDYISELVTDFVEQYINTNNNFPPKSANILIVGSDQVWRSTYVDPLKYMFADISNNDTKRISYAASFGVDDLSEYTPLQLERTAELAKKFSAFSVRETSGIGIIKRNWGMRSLRHVDPTLLLNVSEYNKLIEATDTNVPKGSLFVYILDRNEKKTKIVNKIEQLTNTKVFDIMPKEYESFFDFLNNKQHYAMPKVEQWLRSFRDADFIVTDSFHGTVFSIIFNKPFISIGNEGRGLTRFSSLLEVFGLEDRLVSNVSDITNALLGEKIDWLVVNEIKKREQRRSAEYLKQYLEPTNEQA